MNLLDFLNAVTPARGKTVLAEKIDKPDFSFFKHYVFDDLDSAETWLLKYKGSNDLYFALASFKQGFYVPEGKTKKVVRVRKNVQELKALWFDIDFKDGYDTPKDVGLALAEFCKKTGMPGPSLLVHSGNGMHAYWPFTESIPMARWHGMALALKGLAASHGLRADLACTADACRVLRPPHTWNRKDPSTPKEVKVLYNSGKEYSPAKLEQVLKVDASPLDDVPEHLRNHAASFDEYTAGGGASFEAYFSEVVENCAVMKHTLETHGAEQSEPEWSATLQLLKHCEDGELYVHDVSSGHPGYSEADTLEKWQQKLENDSGPTLCETFHGFHPEKCEACPFWKKIKTPLSVGSELDKGAKQTGIVIKTWRARKDGMGMERLFKDEDGNRYWQTVLPYVFEDIKHTESMSDGTGDLSFTFRIGQSDPKKIVMPISKMGASNKLDEFLCTYGCLLDRNALRQFWEYMSMWMNQLREKRMVDQVTDHMGWVDHEGEMKGFSVGSETYFFNGDVRTGVRVHREYQNIASHYEPVGKLEVWQEVAQFLTEQNNPAFTAILASAFAAPLLRFSGEQGAILSLVSTESGVGKSSALKTAQAVWGSPTDGMQAINDTVNSVIRKLGFLKNLPIYWDEIRGQQALRHFCELAFQMTQGKEKSRLTQQAQAMEVRTWNTLIIAASNESIFDAVGRGAGASDAGVMRVYEMEATPMETEMSKAAVAHLFASLNDNYGHAGRIYGEWLTTNIDYVRAKMREVSEWLGEKFHQRTEERFWFATMTTLLCGAIFAEKAGLMTVDTKALTKHLYKCLQNLRQEGAEIMLGSSPRELLIAYLQQHQDRVLVTTEFPREKIRSDMTEVDVIQAPKGDRLIAQVAKDENKVRVVGRDFRKWLQESSHITWDKDKWRNAGVLISEPRAAIGLGTRWQLPRAYLYEFVYDTEDYDEVDS